MPREDLVNKAIEAAQQQDERVSLMVANRFAPDLRRLAAYQGRQVQLRRAFATPEDPEVIGVKRA